MKGIRMAMDNVAQATKTADRHRRRSELNLDPSKNKVNNPATVTESAPPQDDDAAQNDRRELIKENRELHRREYIEPPKGSSKGMKKWMKERKRQLRT